MKIPAKRKSVVPRRASGPKKGQFRKDDLFDRLEKLKKNGSILINNENQRNRALKWTRSNRCRLITRKVDGHFTCWRIS